MLAALPELSSRVGPNRVFRAPLLVAIDGEPPYDLLDTVFEEAKGRGLVFRCQIEAECALTLGDTERGLAAIELVLFDQARMDFCPSLEAVRQHPRFLAVKALVDARAARVVAAYLAPEA